MIAIPSVDLKGGLCVDLCAACKDELGSVQHPVSVARWWANIGFQRLHLLDLDAESGTGANGDLVEDVIRDAALEVDAGGAVQTTDQIDRLVSAGASKVVLGIRAIEEPEWLASVAHLFPGALVVSTDVRERRVATRGWVRTMSLDIFDLLDDLAGLPLGGLLVTTVGVEGQRSGADLSLLEDVAEACAAPVIAAGGVRTMNELRALEHRGVHAVLLGQALYSAELDPRSVAQEFGG